YLKQRTQVDIRIGANAAIYTSAVLEYLTAEVAGARWIKRSRIKRITSQHLQLAVRTSLYEELDTLVQATIADGASGVLPFVRRAAHKGLTVGKIRKPEG
ncbi:hypothetical protein EDB85DRAFT_2119952, partial [Lactarius pseudohatsudake]